MTNEGKATVNGSIQEVENDIIESDGHELSWRKYFIGPILGFYMLGYLMSFYTITEYTSHVWRNKKLSEANLTSNITGASSCSTNESGLEVKTLKQASSLASEYNMYYSLAQGIPAVVSNLILGSYTDAFGRKFLLTVGIIGTTIRVILSFFIVYFKKDLLFFIVACVIEGCTGQFVTTFQVCLAYAGDITKRGDKRTYGVAYVLFNLSVFGSLGSLAAGYVIETYTFYSSFLVAGVILILTLLVMLTLLPESLPPEKRLTDKSLITVMYNSFSFFFSKDIDNNRWKYRLIIIAHAFCDFSFLGRILVETLYQLAEPFCWSVEQIGWYGTARVFGMSLFSVALVKIYKFFLSDISLAIVGTIAYAVSFLLTALANNNTMLYAAAAVSCFGGLEGTMTRSIVSSMTSPQRQGAIFSAFAAVEVIVNLLSNVGTSAIYSLTVQFSRGFVFYVMAGFDSVATIILIILYIGCKMEKKTITIETL
ncbi:hypothetical protein ACF0H5_003648 [Mactra antiquata]